MLSITLAALAVLLSAASAQCSNFVYGFEFGGYSPTYAWSAPGGYDLNAYMISTGQTPPDCSFVFSISTSQYQHSGCPDISVVTGTCTPENSTPNSNYFFCNLTTSKNVILSENCVIAYFFILDSLSF